MSKIEQLNFNEIKFSSTKKTSGLRFIQVFLDKKPLDIKLPKLRLPFDCKLNLYGQLELNMCLGTNESLIKKIEEFDELIQVSSSKWISQEGIYTPMLKKTDNYSPTIKVKFSLKNDEVDTVFYDSDRKKMNVKTVEDVVSILKKGSYVKTVISCVGVWIKDQEKYGVTWKLAQIQVFNNLEEKNDEYVFESDDDLNSDVELLID